MNFTCPSNCNCRVGSNPAATHPIGDKRMKIKQILSQNRRDFQALYECGHCGHEKQSGGYDDSYFHKHVVPEMVCDKCGKAGEENYRPLTTKYRDDFALY